MFPNRREIYRSATTQGMPRVGREVLFTSRSLSMFLGTLALFQGLLLKIFMKRLMENQLLRLSLEITRREFRFPIKKDSRHSSIKITIRWRGLDTPVLELFASQSSRSNPLLIFKVCHREVLGMHLGPPSEINSLWQGIKDSSQPIDLKLLLLTIHQVMLPTSTMVL